MQVGVGNHGESLVWRAGMLLLLPSSPCPAPARSCIRSSAGWPTPYAVLL